MSPFTTRGLALHLGMFVLGAAAMEVAARAACEFKCDSVKYFTENEGAPMDMRPWNQMTSVEACRRIWNTDQPDDNFVGGTYSTEKYKQVNLDGIGLGCWANGNVWGVGRNPMNPSLVGEEKDITCWEECVHAI
jgi:hypothetical protein